MGDEARCTVRFGGARSVGKALLETDELIFRGDFRIAVPLNGITALDASDGELRVEFADGEATFELGPKVGRADPGPQVAPRQARRQAGVERGGR